MKICKFPRSIQQSRLFLLRKVYFLSSSQFRASTLSTADIRVMERSASYSSGCRQTHKLEGQMGEQHAKTRRPPS